jgi:hypothetical protein
MATLVQVSGLPASGKTYGVHTLNPEETFVIDSDRKGLPFKGWKNSYNKEKKNYIRESNMNNIVSLMKGINEKMPHIKNIVLAGINSVMSDKEMAETRKAGYDEHTCRIKTSLIAGTFLELHVLQSSYEIRAGLNC